MKALVFLGLCSMLLASCYSYHVFPKEDRRFQYEGERRTAVVINPELAAEYAILQHAGIFQLTNDTLASTAVRIKLYPMAKAFVCGNAIVPWAIFLGQLPVYFPDRYGFKFDETDGGVTVTNDFELQVAQRWWFWDFLRFRKKFAANAGCALAAKYTHRK